MKDSKKDKLKNRNIYLFDNIDQISIENIVKTIVEINIIDKINSKKYKNYQSDPINIYINTFGGSPYSALPLYSVIKSSKTDINTYAIGAVMSAGLIIYLAGKERFCYKYSTFMFHEVASDLNGKAEEMKKELIELDRLQEIYNELVIKNTNLDLNELNKIIKKSKDWYIDHDLALKLGIVTKII